MSEIGSIIDHLYHLDYLYPYHHSLVEQLKRIQCLSSTSCFAEDISSLVFLIPLD